MIFGILDRFCYSVGGAPYYEIAQKLKQRHEYLELATSV